VLVTGSGVSGGAGDAPAVAVRSRASSSSRYASSPASLVTLGPWNSSFRSRARTDSLFLQSRTWKHAARVAHGPTTGPLRPRRAQEDAARPPSPGSGRESPRCSRLLRKSVRTGAGDGSLSIEPVRIVSPQDVHFLLSPQSSMTASNFEAFNPRPHPSPIPPPPTPARLQCKRLHPKPLFPGASP
jgi:hypothetical protein